MNSPKKGLHHIEIYVSDLGRSKQFWSWFLELLDYKEFQNWDTGFSFKHGDTYIVFVQTLEKAQEPTYHRCRTGLNHLAFWASSPEQVDQITKLLKAREVPILYPDLHPHAGGSEQYAVYFEDPDRIKVELVALSSIQ